METQCRTHRCGVFRLALRRLRAWFGHRSEAQLFGWPCRRSRRWAWTKPVSSNFDDEGLPASLSSTDSSAKKGNRRRTFGVCSGRSAPHMRCIGPAWFKRHTACFAVNFATRRRHHPFAAARSAPSGIRHRSARSRAAAAGRVHQRDAACAAAAPVGARSQLAVAVHHGCPAAAWLLRLVRLAADAP